MNKALRGGLLSVIALSGVHFLEIRKATGKNAGQSYLGDA
jgi:hypothetical protein